MHKTFRYRLYPTGVQVLRLTEQLSEACRLYNAALQERRDAWRLNRKSINYNSQSNQLKEIRAAGDLTLANFSACQDVLRRVDKTFRAFFRRVKGSGKAGYPRFKSLSRFDSFTFPSYGDGCRLIDSKLRLQGIGLIKIKLHRPITGVIKTVTVKREAGKWYTCFNVEYEVEPTSPNKNSVGIDVGLLTFATLSNGVEVGNPRYYREAQKKLRKVQRKVARRKRGSHRYYKAVLLLQKVHTHVRNQRTDFHHKLSRWLVNNYGLIAVEDLNVKGLARGKLAKSINDAGWSAFIVKLAQKAEEATRVLIKVNPRGTSQRCICGSSVPKDLNQRWHECRDCGLSVPRDHASALEILRLGLSLQASSQTLV